MAELDDRHWWYRARREILSKLIARKIRLPKQARILEIGCGTGHNLEMLRHFGRVDGIEIDAAARAVANRRLGHRVMDAPLPELPGVEDRAYDLVAILDVLEHVEADREALASIARKLKPGGRILITVPAHPWMWSAHDEVNHHKRRYTRATLSKVVAEAGLKLEMMSWFNSLLFPLAAAARLAGRLTGKEDSDDKLPPAALNRLFEALFGLERYAIGRLPLPPGVSLVAIVSAS
jgi:SAM-dependent methyltransferase